MDSLSVPGIYRGGISGMETDSTAGDVDSIQGGMVSLDPVLDGILMDSFCQQQGWMRVYGKQFIVSSCSSISDCNELNAVGSRVERSVHPSVGTNLASVNSFSLM